MAQLRDPENGCPWDLQQNFKSILPYTLEESYEVADAIDRDDMDDLKEELGDLLFQSVYHAQMAAEQNLFDIYDVIKTVTTKMISRHPHVFGDQTARNAQDVQAIWEKRKEDEKPETASALDGVPDALPALLRAQKLQKKAAKTGFEWTDSESILDKLEEELQEMRKAVAEGTLNEKADELGDLFFVLTNLARHLNLNAEEALRQCNHKFERRFRGMEEDLKNEKRSFSDMTLDDMTSLWNAQKCKE